MSTYTKATKEVYEQVKAVMAEHEKELAAIGVTIDILFAHAPRNEEDEKTGPAIKVHGYPADGCISATNLKQRVLGIADALMILDAGKFDEMSPDEQAALIHHEIHHLQVARKVDGETIFDAAARPKLKMRLHDIEAGWFTEIARIHGLNSGEVQQAQEIFAALRQEFFPFVADIPAVEVPQLNAPKRKRKKAA